MSDSTAGLRRHIDAAIELQSVVRAMKALAASSIAPYEKSVAALADYDRAVQLGLSASFRAGATATAFDDMAATPVSTGYGAIVFGSDQGLVGQFNEVVADFAIRAMAALPGRPTVLAVGERVAGRLTDAGLAVAALFVVPGSVQAITSAVAKIQVASEAQRIRGGHASVYLFHNRPREGASFEPVSQRLLPLDQQWRQALRETPWPTRQLADVMGPDATTLRGLIREYLFISIFRACAQSLASETASRLMAMERADKNIDELLAILRATFHRLRQSSIDEELFDVVSGYESLVSPSVTAA
ncbi:MAG: F0F1 ATP synthase subunit gamma [Pseudomonadota bacterium]|nr:F0F1 ATP synthase subunit gamma [Pseudomonadota bacterium]